MERQNGVRPAVPLASSRDLDRLHPPLSRRVALHRGDHRSRAPARRASRRHRRRVHPLPPSRATRLPRARGRPLGRPAARGGDQATPSRRQARPAVSFARRDLLFLVGALLAAAVCARLGLWQVRRLGERRARNAEIAAARARPPLAIEGRGPLVDDVRDRRVRARGLFDYDHETLWRARTFEGVPGVDLITPLRLADGSAVLVDRGWVPSPDAVHVDHRVYREEDSAAVEGLALPAPRGRADVDPRTYTDSVSYPLLPFVLQRTGPVGRSDRPTATGRESFRVRPRRWPPPELDDGPHLSYAVQWFSFATIILVGTGALLRRRRKQASNGVTATI